ncbi:hypothetical protein CLF_104852 [Clonorchis sinensis]|uniref:Pol-related protein n=1 Tax=Clonorchis sinensis TaxID=79923 RepID=H2KQV8_CLOSI|nr:hypothetical protein CLF_104852 [Clonorchis sinensis]
MPFGGDSAKAFLVHCAQRPEDITRMDGKKDLGIWLYSKVSFSPHHEKSAQKTLAVLRMFRRTLSRITRMDFQVLCGAYVRPLFEYANQVVYSGRTKDVTVNERVQRAATKMVAGLKSVGCEARLLVLHFFPSVYPRLQGDLLLTYALFEQGLANRFFTVDPANTRQGHGKKIFKLRTHTIGRGFSHFGYLLRGITLLRRLSTLRLVPTPKHNQTLFADPRAGKLNSPR